MVARAHAKPAGAGSVFRVPGRAAPQHLSTTGFAEPQLDSDALGADGGDASDYGRGRSHAAPPQRDAAPAISDEQLFSDLSAMEQSNEPKAIQPMHSLFQE